MKHFFATPVTLAFLAEAVVAAPSFSQCSASVRIVDGQRFDLGSYMAWLAPWNSEGLVRGVDYWECMGVDPQRFPNGTQIVWNWPDGPPRKRGVYSFLAVDFGDYNRSVVKSPIHPKPISDIRALRQTYSANLSMVNADGYNLILNTFLTSRPGDQDSKAFELEVFAHTPPTTARYVLNQTRVAEFKSSGREWIATIDQKASLAPDILIVPAGLEDVSASSLDLKEMFDALTRAGVLTGREYFNGMAFGAEVIRGAGAISIGQLATDYR